MRGLIVLDTPQGGRNSAPGAGTAPLVPQVSRAPQATPGAAPRASGTGRMEPQSGGSITASGRPWENRLGGMTVLRRIALSSLRAGIEEIILVSDSPPPEDIKELPRVRWMRRGDETSRKAVPAPGSPFLWISPVFVFHSGLVSNLMSRGAAPGEAALVFHPELKETPALAVVHPDGEKIHSLEIPWEGLEKREVSLDSSRGPVPARTPRERRDALRWLLKGLVKENEGFMSRWVERKISLFMTRFLVNTRVTPNAVTVFSTLVGIAGAWLISRPDWALRVWGAVLFLFHSIVDGCDGEIARLKFQESGLGAFLDFWGDNVVHVAVFWGIAWGIHAEKGGVLYIALGLAAAAAVIANAGLVGGVPVMRSILDLEGHGSSLAGSSGPTGRPLVPEATRRVLGPAQRRLLAFQDMASRRDFIYLVLILALLGKLEWFVWLAAFGGWVYFAGLLYLKKRGQAAF